jgi:hypothetical protein
MISMISNISNQVPLSEHIAVSLASSQFAYFIGHKLIILLFINCAVCELVSTSFQDD